MSRNRFGLPVPSIAKRFQKYLSSLDGHIKNSREEEEALGKVFSGIRSLFLSLGKPVMKNRKIPSLSPPDSSDINDTFTEVAEDLSNLYLEQQTLAQSAVVQFNNRHTTHDLLEEQIKSVSDKTADFVVLSENVDLFSATWQDSFNNKLKIETGDADVRVEEGIVTLATTGRESRIEGARARLDNRDSENDDFDPTPRHSIPSNFLIARKARVGDKKFQESIQNSEGGKQWELIYNRDPHDVPAAMFDNRPDTWFEWQMVNVPEGAKKSPPEGDYPDTKGYGWTWKDGSPMYYGQRGKDELKLTVTVELQDNYDINMITLRPYFPEKAPDLLVVDGVYTSENRSDWELVHESGKTFEIGLDTNFADPSLPNPDAYRGVGVWVFPRRKANWVRFALRAPESYIENIAHLYWMASYDVKTTKKEESRFLFWTTSVSEKTTVEHVEERVEGEDIEKEAVMNRAGDYDNYLAEGAVAGAAAGAAIGGPVGAVVGGVIGGLVGLLFGTDIEVTKEVQNYDVTLSPQPDVYTDGWRWMIGIRDIGVEVNEFSPTSIVVTKPIVLGKPVRELSLSVNEEIPEAFYESDLKSKNEWIRYYVSIDDGGSWIRISPREHSAVPDVNFPPKIVAFRQSDDPEDNPNRTVINTDEPVQQIRLKAELSRPQSESMDTITPILSFWSLQMVLEGDIPS